MNPLLPFRLRSHGILVPRIAITRAAAAGLPLHDACAILMMETGGGRDVYGHDPVRNPIKSPPGGSLKVTAANYAVYRHYRRLGYGMQGVGAVQLTWYSFQDLADRYGGCWRLGPQLRVGFEHLVSLIHHYGQWGGFRAYNGTGPAATHYANAATAYARHFQWVIQGARLNLLAANADAESRDHDDSFDDEYAPLDTDGSRLPIYATAGH